MERNKKHNDRYGVLLYSLTLLSYFIFAITWIGVANLKGNADGGWGATYFDGTIAKATEQIINYVISFMGGVGSLLAGHFLVKYGHKKSVILSMTLISIAIIAPWLHQDVVGPDYVGFVLFIGARLFISLGGTIIIIYIQPIIAHYVQNSQTKMRLCAITPVGYNMAILFCYLIVSISPEVSQTLFDNWQIVISVLALPIIPLLLLYLIKAENFPDQAPKIITKNVNDQDNLKSVFKDKRAWILSLLYLILLVSAMIPIYLFPSVFSGLNTSFSSGASNTENAFLGYFNWGGLYIICLMSGVFVSIFTVAAFNKTNYQRRGFMMIMSVLTILMFIGSILCTMAGEKAIWGTLIFGFLTGVILWGVQSLIWTIPFELKNQSPKRIGLIFALMRSIGYFGLTFFNILFAFLADPALIPGTVPGFNGQDIALSSVIFISVFLGCVALGIPILIFLPKSHFAKVKVEKDNEIESVLTTSVENIKVTNLK